jgi:hypothetical protein
MPLPLLLGRAAGVRLLLLTPLVSGSLVGLLLDDNSLSVPYELAEEECKVISGRLILYRAGI